MPHSHGANTRVARGPAMRNFWLLAITFTAGAQIHAAPAADTPPGDPASADPVVQVDFSNPALSPPQWTIVLRADGTGHFRSQADKTPNAGMKVIEAPSVDREIQLSKEFTGQAFDTA